MRSNYPSSLKDMANKFLNKMAVRKCIAVESLPEIQTCRAYHDGNFAFVVIETGLGDSFIGTSKFNPADKTWVKQTNKNGKEVYRQKSKYDPLAGEMKALHRAVEKMLF